MLPAGVVALLGIADIRHLGISLDAVMLAPGSPWEKSVRISVFGRIRRAFRRCFGLATPPERRVPPRTAHLGPPPEHRTKTRNVDHRPPPEDRPWRRAPQSAPPRRSVADLDPRTPGEIEAGQALLEATRAHCTEEQRRHTANRVSQLFTEGLARKRALKDAKLKEDADAFQSSSSRPVRWTAATWPRKRPKFYAVRKGRNIGIYNTWEECEMQVKGVASEYKSFGTFEEAKAYLTRRRLNFMIHRRPTKPSHLWEAEPSELNWRSGRTVVLIRCALSARWTRCPT
jgi:hypothetical protein